MTGTGNTDRASALERAIALKQASARTRGATLSQRPAGRPPRLSEMQRSLWVLHQLDPGSPAYNLASAFRLSAPPDHAKLAAGFETVVSRHRVLRSTYRQSGDVIAQIVHSDLPCALEVIEAEDGDVLETATREARRPFDLAVGPLVRLILVQEPLGHDSILVLILHHIVADERSLGQLWQELAGAYRGQPFDVQERQFDDYVHWLTKQDDNRTTELEYWRKRLDPVPDPLALPFEKLDGGHDGPRGRLLTARMPGTLADDVRHLASSLGTTPFAVYAFTFRLLLERYGQNRLTSFATPISTRSHPATAEMIGYFLNPVVVRASIDEDDAVETAIRSFSDELREALSHASVPFDTLAEQITTARRSDRHPIFQTMFVYQEPPTPPTLGDVRMEEVALDLGESKFDLSLFVSERPGELELAVEYRADRYQDVWMRSLLAHYETLARNLSRPSKQSVARIPMLTDEESVRLDQTWQGASLDRSTVKLLPEQIHDAAVDSPHALAVLSGGTQWTYADLESAGQAVAAALVAKGVGPDDRVALFLDRSAWLIAGVLGTQAAGAAYVPLDPTYPPARNSEVLQDAGVAAVLTTNAIRSRVPAGVSTLICVDQLRRSSGDARVSPTLSPDSPAYLLYTSGSTGGPKGVLVTHGNLQASTLARSRTYESTPGRFLILPSVAFDSSVAGLFWTLSSGGTLVVPSDDQVADIKQLVSLVADERVSSLLCVPSLYAALLRFAGDRLRTLSTVIVAGESCPAQLIKKHFETIPHARLFNEYGPTEATVWATVQELTERDAREPVPIGHPISGVSVHVLDERRRPVPAGIPGQAWIAGPTVARGYWKRPELTSARFVTDLSHQSSRRRMYRTGDRAAWTPDGALLFLGREDDQIKLRGFRIEPGEIEAALLEHADVEEAVVVARGYGDADDDATRLVAFLRTTGVPAPVDRRANLEGRLPDFMVPQHYVELAEFPRLPNGKVDRAGLRSVSLGADSPSPTHVEPSTDLERAIASLWMGLLGRSTVGVTDNFFQLGGHSLLVVEMVDTLARDHGVEMVAADVFQNPTVRQLARRLKDRTDTHAPTYSHLFPIQPGGRHSPLIVAIPHFFSEMLATRFRGERPVYGLRGVGLRAEGNAGRWRTMTALAEELVDEILWRFPDDAYILAGYSFGASMAFEAARIMEGRGISVKHVYLIAPMALDFYRLGPLRLQIAGLRKPVSEVSLVEAVSSFLRDNNPFTRQPYGRAWRLAVQRPWRRLLSLIGRFMRLAGRSLTPGILYADVRAERFRLHRDYRPHAIRTPATIFNPQEPETDAAATWRPYFEGSLQVCDTPDPHDGDVSVRQAKTVILNHLRDLKDS